MPSKLPDFPKWKSSSNQDNQCGRITYNTSRFGQKKNPVLAFITASVSLAHLWLIIQISFSATDLFTPKIPGKVVVQNVKLSPPKPIVAQSPPSPPKKAQDKVAAQESKKPTPKPIPKKDPKPIAKTEPKKENPAPKKPIVKDDKKKPKPIAKTEPKPTPKKEPKEIAKEEPDPMIKKLEEESLSPEDFALLQAAKQSIAKIAKNDDKNSDVASASDLPVVSKLDISAPTTTDTSAEEDFYQGDLIRRLQLLLRLPEQGAVTVNVTVTREGKVISVDIVSSASGRNRDYITTELPKITFQPFGSRFPGEATKVFNLTFESHD